MPNLISKLLSMFTILADKFETTSYLHWKPDWVWNPLLHDKVCDPKKVGFQPLNWNKWPITSEFSQSCVSKSYQWFFWKFLVYKMDPPGMHLSCSLKPQVMYPRLKRSILMFYIPETFCTQRLCKTCSNAHSAVTQ